MMKRLSICFIFGICCCGMGVAQSVTHSLLSVYRQVPYPSGLSAKCYVPQRRSVGVSCRYASRQSARPFSYGSLYLPLTTGNVGSVVAEESVRKPLELGYTAATEYMRVSSVVKPVRRGAPPTAGHAYDNWIQSGGAGALDYEIDGVGYYDMNRLYDLWSQYAADNDMPGTWEAFMDWFNNGNQTKYRAPLDDALWYLIMLVGMYVEIRIIRRKKV